MSLKDLGEKISEARKSLGIRQVDLAAELGMSPASLSNIENGTLEEIGIRKVVRLMDRLGLDISAKPLVTGYTSIP